MAFTVNTNLSALNAQRQLNSTQSSLEQALERLSSGKRVNSAKDDAAGLAISTRIQANIRGANQAARNANDGVSLMQTTESALGQIGESLQRMRELAVQSTNATNSSKDRVALDQEFQQLLKEVEYVSESAKFNGINLLDGNFNNQNFQVGSEVGQTINASIDSFRAKDIGKHVAYSGNNSYSLNSSSIGIFNNTIGIDGKGNDATVNGQSSGVEYSPINEFSDVLINNIKIGPSQDYSNLGDTLEAFIPSGSVSGSPGTITISPDVAITTPNPGDRYTLVLHDETTEYVLQDMKIVFATPANLFFASYEGIVPNLTGAEIEIYKEQSVELNAQGAIKGADASSAYSKARAINDARIDGVTAYAEAAIFTSNNTNGFALTAGGDDNDSASLYINNTLITTLSRGGKSSLSVEEIIGEINTKTGEHGVVASRGNVGNLVLSTPDGRNIKVAIEVNDDDTNNDDVVVTSAFGTGTATNDETSEFTVYGKVQLVSNDAVTISGAEADRLGLSAGTYLPESNALAAANIQSNEAANTALLTLDKAIDQVSSQRAKLGAAQKRFETNIQNTLETVANLEATNSRIIDTDFATETSNLTRSQILQQAATSILAQANASQQNVLALLN